MCNSFYSTCVTCPDGDVWRSDVFACCLSIDLLRMAHQIRVNFISSEDRREGTWWSALQRKISICDPLPAEVSKLSVPHTIAIASHDWLAVRNTEWPNKSLRLQVMLFLP